ncbi:uncharacterized protein LOC114319632 [Camellia sinensis]|uniref:uncharacterized protein LOC114319632 n=1 Tax=Camellia sinensis TaxID=4442 RepID=UPI001035E128|nr:uncharacterized protein LOC114319632 [Camellia sinensis]
MFYAKKSAKELLDALDKKYKIEDAVAKKFVVGWFLDFKMVDSKTIISQAQDFQLILHKIHAEGMLLSESFQAATLIEKLPLDWKNFKNYLKHRFNGKCYNCGSDVHRAIDCHKKKKSYKKNPPQNKSRAHMAEMEDLSLDIDDMHLLADVFEVNMVGSNLKEWWVDTRATCHIYAEKKMFTTFEPISNGEKLFIWNFLISTVEEKCKVVRKMTSRKELTLNDVLFVPDIRKKLVSGSFLSKHGFRMVFESDMVVLTKSRVYVGERYMSSGMFKLNVMTIIPKVNEKVSSSGYMLESPELCCVN